MHLFLFRDVKNVPHQRRMPCKDSFVSQDDLALGVILSLGLGVAGGHDESEVGLSLAFAEEG